MQDYTTLLRRVERLRRRWLLAGMRECGGCVRQFAQRAEMNRTQLYRLLHRYAPEVPRTRSPRRGVDDERRARGGNAAWRALDRPEARV